MAKGTMIEGLFQCGRARYARVRAELGAAFRNKPIVEHTEPGLVSDISGEKPNETRLNKGGGSQWTAPLRMLVANPSTSRSRVLSGSGSNQY
jgi:hypothetical protein